jgi:hypothetical protein
MGGFFSTPVLSDIQTPTVLNFILIEMFRRSDLVDIYSLADSKRCSKYIVAGADALQKLFVKIRVNPIKGPAGDLYFQSMEGLASSLPPDLKAQQRANCLELSFFFIRIFQIFGAVTISMFDNTIPLVDPEIQAPSGAKPLTQKSFLKQSNFNAAFASSGPSASKGVASWLGFGGALSPNDKSFYIPDGSYKILNYHLYKPDGGTSSASPMKFEGYDIYLDQATLYDLSITEGEVKGRVIKSNPKPILKYNYTRDSTPYLLTGTLSISGIDTYTITLSNFTKDGEPVSASISSETLRTFAGDKPASLGQAYSIAKGKTLPTVLQAMFDEAGTKIFGAVPYSTVKFLRKMGYISGSGNSGTAITGTHINIPGGQDNAESPRIIFRDSMPLEVGESNRKLMTTIRANLQIEEPIQNVSDGTFNYRVYVDFSKSSVEPEEAQSYLTLPARKTMNFLAYSATAVPKSQTNDLTITAYLEGVFQGIIKHTSSKNDEGGISLTRSGLPKPFDSESIPPNLRIKDLWSALAKDPPIKSYCIARAVQLLSVDAIRGNMSKPAYSSACALSFAYQKDGSLPSPEKKLSEVHGLHALATLFWTDLETAMPKIQDEVKYKEFLKFMKMNLGNYSKTDTVAPPEKMSDIVEKSGEVCKNLEGTKLQLPSDATVKLRAVVAALIQQQRNHINAGMQVIQMLFDMNSIVNNKVFALNPNMLRGGMPEVNRIAGQARELLMKYYSGCESTYRDGLKILYQSDQQRPLIAIKASGEAIVRAPKNQSKAEESKTS